jgi:hypothetical protein
LSKLYKAANWEINCALTPIEWAACFYWGQININPNGSSPEPGPK